MVPAFTDRFTGALDTGLPYTSVTSATRCFTRGRARAAGSRALTVTADHDDVGRGTRERCRADRDGWDRAQRCAHERSEALRARLAAQRPFDARDANRVGSTGRGFDGAVERRPPH